MLLPSELLASMEQIISHPDSWENEVCYNWVRAFTLNLVCLMNPEYAIEYINLTHYEFLKPQGILAIYFCIKDYNRDDLEKIDDIKQILLEKGYDGEHIGYSWKRTEYTHNVYCNLAEMIADYEKQMSDDIADIIGQAI